jgi:hypothetical protein
MGHRTTLITAGLALVSTLAIAQRTTAPAPTSGAATTTGAASTAGATAAANTAAIQAPGQSNVPIGVNAIGAGNGTTNGQVPTAVIVPLNANGFVAPAQSFPLVSTPTLTFVNSADGTTTVPVLNYNGGTPAGTSNTAGAAGAAANTTNNQTADLNLGSVSSISELYGGDNRGVAEISRMYKARKNGVQNARVYTNADIARIRQQEGGSSSATPASDQSSMPASDQSAEQNNQSTTPQVQQPAANQKPSPFTPKKQ